MENQSIIQLAFIIFIITNPIGNSPAILTLVKNFPIKRQKWIVLREGIIALGLALFFQYFGEIFLSLLQLKNYTLSFCGGILLFFVAMDLIFPDHGTVNSSKIKTEPYIVPIATPLLTGPGLMTIIMLFATKVPNSITLTLALIVAWIGVIPVLFITPYLQTLLGNKGLSALEQLMGMVLAMVSVEMLVGGLRSFVQSLNI